MGQRRGLRLGVPAADGRPRYVVSTSVTDGTVTVGSAEDLLADVVTGGPPTWCGPAPSAGDRLGAQLTTAEAPCDMLVVGSRPEAQPGRVMITAQAQNAIENARQPVLVVARGVALGFQEPHFIA